MADQFVWSIAAFVTNTERAMVVLFDGGEGEQVGRSRSRYNRLAGERST